MSGAVIVDASVALKWFVAEEDSAMADALLGRAEMIHAPLLLRAELANALWRNWRKGEIDAEQARSSVSSIGRVVGRWHDTHRLVGQALEWSLSHDHPVYDFCYLALAKTMGLPLVTADERLLRKLKGTPEATHLLALHDAA